MQLFLLDPFLATRLLCGQIMVYYFDTGSIIQKLKGLFKKAGSPPYKMPEPDILYGIIRKSTLFKNMSDDNIRKMIARMEGVRRAAGDVIIREGDEGDYYYLLLEGTAEVLKRIPGTQDFQSVAELASGAPFGEEALISNAKRNATVSMKTKGVLLRLPKDAFVDYVRDSLVTWFSSIEAQKKVNQGAKWADTREPLEYQKVHLPGAISLPVKDLRDRLGELDKGTEYICYCENGRISATAAFLLNQNGFKAAVLQGGLKRLNAG